MDVLEKVKRCLARHPDWDNQRIAKSTTGHKSLIEAIRDGRPIPEYILTPASAVESPAACISMSTIRDRLDVATMIRRQISKITKGQLLPEDELCRLTAGRDRNRFRRAVENNPDEFRPHRVKLRLDDTSDGKWFWGQASDISEAMRIRDL